VTELNLFDVAVQKDDDDPDGYHTSYARLGPELGADKLGLTVYQLPPGQSICPYHYETGEEEWLIVLVGEPTLRVPDGERTLRRWDVAFFPAGEEGAHKVTNNTAETVRVAMWSNRVNPATSIYPDSGKVGAWPPGKLFRLADAVEYFDGEL
jgi:uncharacterized cupin superfamily protein